MSAGVWLLFFASLRGKSVLSRRHRHSSLPRNGFLLYHKIRSAAENAALYNLSRDNLYQIRKRLSERLRKVMSEVLAEMDNPDMPGPLT